MFSDKLTYGGELCKLNCKSALWQHRSVYRCLCLSVRLCGNSSWETSKVTNIKCGVRNLRSSKHSIRFFAFIYLLLNDL